MKFLHEFVEYIPEDINEEILYISLPFGTVVHKCACGCGEEVVTPLGPAEWNFTYNGKTISLHPSVGNWSFECRSHYWIKEGNVQWARSFTTEEILESRKKTKEYRKRYYAPADQEDSRSSKRETASRSRIVEKLKELWRRVWKSSRK